MRMFISSPRERIAQIIALLVVLIILGMYIKSIVNDPTMAIMAIPVVFAPVGLVLFGKYKKIKQRRRDESALRILREVESENIGVFAVFLRPFYLTGKMLSYKISGKWMPERPRPYPYDFEDAVVAALQKSIPVTALGRPGEAIGIARVSVDEKSWRRAVTELMRGAQLILCVPSSHPGTRWELNHIIQSGYITKTVFIIPPVRPKEFEEEWKQTRQDMISHDIEFPSLRFSKLFYKGFAFFDKCEWRS